MADTNLTTAYAKALADLEGDAFQIEVCARFETAVLGFQQIPAIPHGDGGLDGLSHEGRRAYCCYGPQHSAAKTSLQRTNDIVKKFSADLRKLFELDTKGKKKLIHKPNIELGTILPKGKRLVEIKLLVNWFDSHRIIGPILTKVDEYKKESQLRYVDPNVQVSILGPKQIAAAYPVDEVTITRVKQWNFVEKIEQSAKTVTITDVKDFDLKMQILREIRPDQELVIDKLAERLRHNWSMALAVELELSDTAPRLHQVLERGRQQIVTRVTTLMVSSNEPWTQLDRASEIAQETLSKDFETLYGSLVPMVASGEVARLIGECTIGWKKRAAATNG